MIRAPRILVLEDDPLQADWLAEEVIWPAIPEARLLYFDSEYSFLHALSEKTIHAEQPDFAVMDLLVRFYSPQDLAALPTPPKLDNLPDPRAAGIRCRKALMEACPMVKPVIVTVLDCKLEDCFVIKKGDERFSEVLIKFLKE
ncbi:MAG: hypothetical protein H7A45_05085 [Verrucomicrobiales bacterium]|nr:hypothetical protein [Verrucomicrobiales bacterium]MCP5528561.1 hypothetical protein [Verrucomicrobiales bacterium]